MTKTQWRPRVAAVFAVVSVVGVLAGCATSADNADNAQSSQVAAPSSVPPNLPPLTQCPGDQGAMLCLYGVNQAQVYTGVGQLGPAALTLSNKSNNSNSDMKSPWPTTWGAANTVSGQCPYSSQASWCAAVYEPPIPDDPQTLGMTATYSTPSVFGSSETVQLNIGGSSTNSGYASSCPTQSYFSCAIVLSESGAFANFVADLSNAPLTVMIANNLNDPKDTLNVTQVPQAVNMKVDPTGTNLNATSDSIAPGAVGYVGTYMPTSLTKLPSTAAPSMTLALEVSASSGDNLGNTSIAITVPIKNQTVDLSSPSTVCNVAVDGTGFAYCSPTVVGAPGGPQTLVLNITEFQTP